MVVDPNKDGDGSSDRPGDSEVFTFSSGDDSRFSWDDGNASTREAQGVDTRLIADAGADQWTEWVDGTDLHLPQAQPSAVPPGSPPLRLLALGAAMSVAGVLVAVLLRESWVGLGVGWLLAGPLAILALGQYVEKDGLQRSRPMYTGGSATRHYPTILGALALLSVVVVAVLAAGKAAKAW